MNLLAAFGALADETRLGLVRLLAAGPKTATELFTQLSISQPRASRHLRILREAGLVVATRCGRWVHFRIAEDDLTRRIVALATGREPAPVASKSPSGPRREPATPARSGAVADVQPATRPSATDGATSPRRPAGSPEIEEFLL